MGRSRKNKKKHRGALARKRPPATSPSNTPVPRDTPPSQRYVAKYEGYQGPIPPPVMMEQFNAIIPRGADRIMQMAESQLEHRQTLEKSVVLGGIRSESRGQFLAFILYAMLIIAGTTLLILDKSIAGLATLLTGAAAFVSTFFASRRSKRAEIERKKAQS